MTFSKSMKMKNSLYSVVAVNFFFPLSTLIGNLSQFISQRNLSPTYNGQFVFFCLKNTLKNVSLHRGNKIALEVLSTGNSFTQISSGINEILKMPIKILCSSKRNSFVYCPFTKIFFSQTNASKQRKMFIWGFVKILANFKNIIFKLKFSLKTGINNIGPALYLYKNLQVLSLLQAAHLETLLLRF